MQDSRLLRTVDRSIGKAACGAISWARSLRRRVSFFGSESTAPVEKVLLVELFEMGAAIMLAPSISYLKKQNPKIEIHCLATRTCLPVWNTLGIVDADKIHVMESSSPVSFLLSAMRVLWSLRKIRFDLIVDYELFMRISAIFVGVLRARRRAGFYRYSFEGLERGEFFESRCAYNQNSHIARNYLSLTKTGFERRENMPNFKDSIPASEIEFRPLIARASAGEIAKIMKVDGFAGPYLAVCADVGKTLAVRNYPRPSFAAVIRDLLKHYPEHRIVMIGTEEDRATSGAILGLVGNPDRCIDLCGKTSFKELLQVISAADLLITNDNGPGHFATVTGTKTLALFSTDSPFVYGPLGDAVIAYSFFQCSPCISAYNHKTSVCDDNKCLQALPPERVTELARRILDGKVKFRTINGEISYLP